MQKQNNDDLELLYGIKPTGDKITVKSKIFSEVINIAVVLVIYFTVFLFLGKPILIPKYSQEAITNINNIYLEIAKEEGYDVVTIKSNYGFIEIDENKFVNQYLKENPDKLSEQAYEKYFETRAEMFSKVREHSDFSSNNAKFNSIYFAFFIVTMFVLLFIFEFIIPLFSKKHQTIGMMIFKTSITNVNDNDYPNKLKLIPRFFIIFLLEHLLIRYFFGNIYFIVLLLLDLILLYVTPSKLVLHDILSMTKVIRTDYVGYIEA